MQVITPRSVIVSTNGYRFQADPVRQPYYELLISCTGEFNTIIQWQSIAGRSGTGTVLLPGESLRLYSGDVHPRNDQFKIQFVNPGGKTNREAIITTFQVGKLTE